MLEYRILSDSKSYWRNACLTEWIDGYNSTGFLKYPCTHVLQVVIAHNQDRWALFDYTTNTCIMYWFPIGYLISFLKPFTVSEPVKTSKIDTWLNRHLYLWLIRQDIYKDHADHQFVQSGLRKLVTNFGASIVKWSILSAIRSNIKTSGLIHNILKQFVYSTWWPYQMQLSRFPSLFL